MRNIITRPLIAIFAAFSTALAYADTAKVSIVQITSPEGRQSYIVGTVHLSPPQVPQAATSLLAGKSKLYVESNSRPRQSPVPNDRFPGLKSDSEMAPWARELTHDELVKFQGRMTCHGIPLDISKYLSRDTPRLASSVAWLPACEVLLSFYRPDREFEDEARRIGVPVVYLDAPQQMAASYAAIPASVFLDSLRVGLKTIDLSGQYQTTAEAVSRGDYDYVARSFPSAFTDPKLAGIYLNELVVKRNQLWVKKLLPALAAGNVVVVVGAGHVAGTNGLLSMLSKEGYGYKLVDVPAYYPSLSP